MICDRKREGGPGRERGEKCSLEDGERRDPGHMQKEASWIQVKDGDSSMQMRRDRSGKKEEQARCVGSWVNRAIH